MILFVLTSPAGALAREQSLTFNRYHATWNNNGHIQIKHLREHITKHTFRNTEALGKRFGSAKEAMIHQAAFENTRRKPGQTIPALGQE